MGDTMQVGLVAEDTTVVVLDGLDAEGGRNAEDEEDTRFFFYKNLVYKNWAWFLSQKLRTN